MAHPTSDDLNRAVSALADWAYSDSHVELDDLVKDALLADFATAGRLPSDDECELLITGNDDGEIPEELTQLFPKTHAYLATFWE